MSAGINERDDMMLERTAWHRLGRVVGKAFGWLDAIAEGLPITQEVSKVAISDLLIGYECQPDEYAAVATDGFVISTGHGEQWTPFNAADAYDFGEAIRNEATDTANANLLSLGTLHNRRQWFMTYDLGDFDVVGYGAKDYLTLSGSFDSSRLFQAVSGPTLVVCANTLAASDFGMKHYRFKHTSGIVNRVEEAKRALQTHRGNRAALIATCEQLASRPLSGADYSTLLQSLFPTGDDASSVKASNVADTARQQVTQLFKGAPVNNISAVTNGDRDGFTFVQAVNTYEQWLAPVKKTRGLGDADVRALRQFDAAADGKQPLTDKAISLVLA